MDRERVVTVAEIGTYLRGADVGRMLGVGPTRAKELAREGQLEYIETALGLLIEPRSVERLIEKRRQSGHNHRGVAAK